MFQYHVEIDKNKAYIINPQGKRIRETDPETAEFTVSVLNQELLNQPEILEENARAIRRKQQAPYEKQWLRELQICYANYGPLDSFFTTQNVHQQVNLINLEARGWIHLLDEPQDPTAAFYNRDGHAYHDNKAQINKLLREKWHKGQPAELTVYGHLSLAYGYIISPLSGGEIHLGSQKYRIGTENEEQSNPLK